MNAIDFGVDCELGRVKFRGAAETVKDGFSAKPHVSTFAVSSCPEPERRQGFRAIWCSVHLNMSLSANALLATIAAIGAADVSYCMLSHPGSFLSSTVRGFAFSRLLLHAQGSFP